MNARETGLRRIRLVTRGLAAAGVAGAVAFAGMARAATEADRATPTDPNPTSSTTGGSTGHSTGGSTGTTRRGHTVPNPGPPVTGTDQQPQVRSGGS